MLQIKENKMEKSACEPAKYTIANFRFRIYDSRTEFTEGFGKKTCVAIFYEI